MILIKAQIKVLSNLNVSKISAIDLTQSNPELKASSI